MSRVFEAIPRPHLHAGAGAAARLPACVRELGADAALVVCDRDALPAAELLLASLRADGLRARRHVVEDAVATEAAARDATAALPAGGTVAVVAVGGQSPIDLAKLVALRADRALPIVALPTTAGPGAEASAFALVGDPAAGRDRHVGHPSALPRVAILDPSLVLGPPFPAAPSHAAVGVAFSPYATAAGGVEVLARAVEAVLAPPADAETDALALEALRLAAAHLGAAVRDPHDVASRGALLLAAHLAALAAGRTGAGLAHALARALHAGHGADHATALAAVLPAVVAHHAAERPAEAGRLALAAGVADGADGLADALATLQASVGMLPTLKLLGVARAELPALAAAALADEAVLTAPSIPSRPDLVRLLTRIWGPRPGLYRSAPASTRST